MNIKANEVYKTLNKETGNCTLQTREHVSSEVEYTSVSTFSFSKYENGFKIRVWLVYQLKE
jgi:hypothetical protein